MQLKMGTRDSRLAMIQARETSDRLGDVFPGVSFKVETLSSPGDRDREKNLRESPPDFFTRDLDEALLRGDLDCAVHSAKDVPESLPEKLDWFWLPWREDPRDVLVAAEGRHAADMPDALRIGVSSERREAYCRARFPGAKLLPVRGNIEDRLRQVDEGRFDLVVMAGCALIRLGLADRITEWISPVDLSTPDGQGVLCLTFRSDNPRLLRLRSLFVKSAAFVGAGAGAAELCTVAGVDALRRCDVCLHDALLDPALLDSLPAGALRIDVGKRCGAHGAGQEAINDLLALHVRRGMRVVRLKGGDPGIFGRLAEEVEALEALHLPYRVVPGVSSLSAVSTGTGMLLTRRGVSRGFCVMSAREKGGKTADVSGKERCRLPCVFFMGTGVIDELAGQLLADGVSADTPSAIVFNAGGDDENVIRATLGSMAGLASENPSGASVPLASLPATGGTPVPHSPKPGSSPGLVIVGEIARHGFAMEHGALRGRRVLLTCSDALLDRAAGAVRDLGGRPIRFPVMRLVPVPDARKTIERIDAYDWVIVTSPSSIGFLLEMLKECGRDIRTLPKLAVSGPATARELLASGLHADICPEREFGGKGVLAAIRSQTGAGVRVLRVRSDNAGPGLARSLRETGSEVDDAVLYRGEPVLRDCLPAFDVVFFASGSAVSVFVDRWGAGVLEGKKVVAIGPPTERILKEHGIGRATVPGEAGVKAALSALAAEMIVEGFK